MPSLHLAVAPAGWDVAANGRQTSLPAVLMYVPFGQLVVAAGEAAGAVTPGAVARGNVVTVVVARTVVGGAVVTTVVVLDVVVVAGRRVVVVVGAALVVLVVDGAPPADVTPLAAT